MGILDVSGTLAAALVPKSILVLFSLLPDVFRGIIQNSIKRITSKRRPPDQCCLWVRIDRLHVLLRPLAAHLPKARAIGV
ncbi:hypothetical protein B0H67DRAFT_139318 [Lasiosphaeris hirsuta]|uniref:Uncharacterized protein n=1 Tax=Lasiosphaeris hirsuta TaxID=260670 RepID=A0AA40B191_9PEZI|nr:hypothetical protein B0H67DRAFT_139318 [Lasiosphaeris hirsuta]